MSRKYFLSPHPYAAVKWPICEVKSYVWELFYNYILFKTFNVLYMLQNSFKLFMWENFHFSSFGTMFCHKLTQSSSKVFDKLSTNSKLFSLHSLHLWNVYFLLKAFIRASSFLMKKFFIKHESLMHKIFFSFFYWMKKSIWCFYMSKNGICI